MDVKSRCPDAPSFLLTVLVIPSAVHSFLPFITQSTFSPWPDHSPPQQALSSLINAFPYLFLFVSPPPHKQDLFLIDASCSVKVIAYPPPPTPRVTFTFHFSAPFTTSSLPPCWSFAFIHPFSASCPARHVFNRSSLPETELAVAPCGFDP